MQFHLTLKEIAQQPWEQGKCQVVSVTRSLLHQCPVLYKTVLPLLTCIAQNREHQHVASSQQSLGIIWCSVGCAWVFLSIFTASWWAPCPMQQLALVCQHTAMIWCCFFFSSPWSYPWFPGQCAIPHCVDTTSQFCLMGRIKFNWQKFMLFYFSKTHPFNTLMIKSFKATSSSFHIKQILQGC